MAKPWERYGGGQSGPWANYAPDDQVTLTPTLDPNNSGSDAGRSLVSHTIHGLADTPGIPGALENLWGEIVDKGAGALHQVLADHGIHIGATPEDLARFDKKFGTHAPASGAQEEPTDYAAMNGLPTTEKVDRLAQGEGLPKGTPHLGPVYQGTTDGAKLAGIVGDYSGAALGGGGPLLRLARVGETALGGEGAKAGVRAAGGGPLAQKVAGVVGSVAGGAGGEMTINKGIASLDDAIPVVGANARLSPADRALALMARTMQQFGKTAPEIQAAANKLKNQGGTVDEMIFDILGEPGIRALRANQAVNGPSMQPTKDAIVARDAVAGDRIKEAGIKAVGLPKKTSPGDFAVALETSNKDAITATYNKAKLAGAKAPIGDKQFAGAGDEARDALYNFGGAPDPTLPTPTRAPLLINPDDSSLTATQQALHVIDKYEKLAASGKTNRTFAETIRQRLNEIYGDARSGTDMRGVKSVIDTFDKRLAQGADPTVEAGFKAGRAEYGTNEDMSSGFQLGQNALKMKDWELTLAMRGKNGVPLNPAQRNGFRIGLLEDINARVNNGEGAFIAQLIRKGKYRDTLEEALGGAKPAARFLNRVQRQWNMKQNGNAVLHGSPTGRIAEDVKALSDDGQNSLGWVGNTASFMGDAKGSIVRGLQKWDAERRGFAGIRNPDVNAAFGKELTARATPDNVKSLLNRVDNNPSARLARARAQERTPTALALGAYGAGQSVRRSNALIGRKTARNATDDELMRAIRAH